MSRSRKSLALFLCALMLWMSRPPGSAGQGVALAAGSQAPAPNGHVASVPAKTIATNGGVSDAPPPASAPSLCDSGFWDVSSTDAACWAIRSLAAEGIIKGYGDGSFHPDQPVTRAEIAKLLVLTTGGIADPSGSVSFTDPGIKSHWAVAQGYLQVAVAMKAINGMPDGTFQPDAPVTRAQLTKMAVAISGFVPQEGNDPAPYTDVTGTWYAGWVKTAVRQVGLFGGTKSVNLWPNLVNGKEQPFYGDRPVTRAEVSRLLSNVPARPLYRQNLGMVPWGAFLNGINAAFGNFTRTYADAKVAQSKGPVVQIQRTYNSFDTADNLFGHGWSFDYDLHVQWRKDGVRVVYPSGREALFLRAGDGSYKAPIGVFDHLVLAGDGYILTDGDGVQHQFRADGKLTRITDRNGNSVVLTYRADNHILITDAEGRVFDLTLEGGHITQVKDPAGNLWRYHYTDGDLDLTEDPLGNQTIFRYEEHRLKEIVGPFAKGGKQEMSLRLDYDFHGRVKAQTDGDGYTTTFDYDPVMMLTVATDAEGGRTTLQYDERFRLTARTDADGKHEWFAYDPNGALMSYTDMNMNGYLWKNDDRGNHTKEWGPDGTVTTTWQIHERFNVPTLITNALGQTTSLKYDHSGNLLSRTDDTSGIQTSFEYYSDGQLKSTTLSDLHNPKDKPTPQHVYYYQGGRVKQVVDDLGLVSETTYDILGRPVRVQDGRGDVTSYTYLPTGQVETETTAHGTTKYEYDPAGNLTRVISPTGAETVYTYNRRNLLTSVTGPFKGADGVTSPVRYEYNGAGHLTRVTDARGNVTKVTTSKAGRLQQTEDAQGAYITYVVDGNFHVRNVSGSGAWPVEYVFDEMNRLTAVERSYVPAHGQPPIRVQATTTYDKLGRVVAQTDETGVTLTYEYRDAERALIVTDAHGNATRYEYDKSGNLVSVTNPRGVRTLYEYDVRGRLRKVTAAAGTKDEAVTIQDFDLAGNRTRVVDPLGHVTTYGYEAGHRLTTVTQVGDDDTPNAVTAYRYDAAGNLLQLTDARGSIWQYLYDAANRLTQITDPLGAVEIRGYDQAGNHTTTRDRNGVLTQFQYDQVNRLTDIISPDSTVHFEYDSRGNRQSMTDATGRTQYRYEDSNRPAQVQTPDGRTLAYTYDAAGRVLTLTDLRQGRPAGGYTYHYDETGHLDSVTPVGGAAIRLHYDAAGNRDLVSYPNGVQGRVQFDSLNRPTSVAWTGPDKSLLASFGYGYDTVGNLTTRKEAGGTFTFGYDAFKRLTKESGPDATRVYTYDAVGNRTAQAVMQGGVTRQTTYQYDAANRISTASGPDGNKTYSWDKNGNLLGDGDRQFQYDRLNRLTQVHTADGKVVSYRYNGDGQMVSRQAGGVTTQFLYDRGAIYLEAEGTGGEARTLSIAGPVLRQVSGQPDAYLLPDAHGDIRGVTGPDGFLVGRWGYDAYGVQTSGNDTVPNPFRYAGAYWDAAVQVYYLGQRFYSSALGRFLTEDTVAGDPARPWTYNRYSYAWNNPLAYVDPTGHWPQWMTKAWSKVKEWASNYRWDVAAAGLADAMLGTGEVIIGGTAVTLGCATVVFCGAAIAGGYAMVDGGSRIVSGAADIIGANDPDYQQGSYNILKNGYVAVLGPDLGGIAYDLAGVAATAGAAFGVAYAKSGLAELEAAATKPTGRSLQPYEVGTFRQLEARSMVGDDLDIHHTPQKALAQDLVPGYPPVPSDDAPSIALPHDEHVQVNIAQRRWMTAYRNGEVAGGLTDRDLLARDLRMLRTYTNAPNNALQELIRLNKAMYGFAKGP